MRPENMRFSEGGWSSNASTGPKNVRPKHGLYSARIINEKLFDIALNATPYEFDSILQGQKPENPTN